jgi:membrane associated rhomboid family serine protease
MFEKTKIVTNLFYMNIIVFVLTIFTPGLFESLAIHPPFTEEFRFYQLITYMFTHGGFLHILFNMFALLSFGPQCEKSLGERNFLLFYFIAGIFGAFAQFLTTDIALVGASASIFGLLIYHTLLRPNDELQIIFLPFISFKAKKLVSVVIIYELLSVIFMPNDGIGHMAHLGGAFIGFIYFFINNKKWRFQNFQIEKYN